MFFKKVRLIAFIFITFKTASAATVDLPPIIIQKEEKMGPKEEFGDKDLESLPFNSAEEIVNYSSGIELRRRNLWGVQQDVSVRGASFEDTFIYINEVKVNDPQTAHFSLEIPFTEFDLDKISIEKQTLKINFRTKKPEAKKRNFKTYFGQHGLFGQIISLNFPLRDTKNRISFEHKVSSGGRQDTDFDIYNFTFDSLLAKENRSLELIFASQKKDFGADSFYSSLYPFEEEHTTQRFFQLLSSFKKGDFTFNNNLYYRRHTDKFILNRHNPPFYTNYHTTYVYGLDSTLDYKEWGNIGFQIGKEKITSTRLANHSRIKKTLALRIKPINIPELTFEAGTKLTHYQGYNWNEEYYSNLSYLPRTNLVFTLSFTRLFRLPSFTDLFYFSPANIGNSSLDAEKIDNFELGGIYKFSEQLKLNCSIFLRKTRNTIDWVKNNAGSPWEAKNIGSLETKGIDLNLNFDFTNSWLKKIQISYTYLASQEKPYNFSKYIFDYNRHKLISILKAEILGTSINLIANFNNPIQRDNYFTCDLKIEKRLSGNLNIFLEGTNIFNKDYFELTDVKASGRWYKIGLEYQF